ncbi:hypothetical protein FNV43_RR11827 [Rhamnella rubrinervis]|uniref:Fungal lipase-type domain-containing protein n=1 Tax=Rhamnella rubrinervis TaxID=2594499 RepID=A0A8K0MI33_9ROSA|nr:hypothetical protein FNV43_RR11827 [Rhamnella rubrinervis]
MGCNEEDACDNYLLLKPKDASVGELIRLLYSSKLEERSFIECSDREGQKPRDFRRRWLIFVSVIVQKLFIYVRQPMAQLGHVLVLWLNHVSTNGGLLNLLLKRIRGEEVRETDPSTYASVVGNLDTRTELDEKIKADDNNYKASLSIMAAKLSYENQSFIHNVVLNHWKMQFLGFYNFWNGYLENPSTKAFMFQDTLTDPKLIVVAFRGTDPFDADAWRTDFDVSWYQLVNVGKMHGGFVKALGLQNNNTWPSEIEQAGGDQKQFAYYEIKKMLKDILQKNENAKFIVTGHSLGGALAILFMAGLAIHEEVWLMDKLEGVYTFGQPRVGDQQFGEFMKEKLHRFNVRYTRYVYCNDMVPRVPFDDKTLLFKHFGPCLYYNSFYQGKVVLEEPNKNYFSLLWIIPKYLNALWELIRSFITPLVKGSDYEETWFMRLFRVVGLVIPGLPAHFTQDYVNVTRLGSIHQGDSKVD